MPNLKSSKKSVKQDIKTTLANNIYTAKVKNSMKKVEKAILAKDSEKANTELKKFICNIDKACSKGLIKKNTCDRQKARLNNKVKEMSN